GAPGSFHMPSKTTFSRRSVLGAGAAGILLMKSGAHAAAASTVADTASGKVAGVRDGTVHIFKGIPYGAPTGGINRFLPPAKPLPWTDARDATNLGARCPQFESTGGSPIAEDAESSKPPMSEDCLFLNVWTAGLRDNRKRPVM